MFQSKHNFFNPFNRNNPYYVPNKFYSDDVRTIYTSHQHHSLKYSASQSSIHHHQNLYSAKINSNEYVNGYSAKENQLKKKSMNFHENPFQRKHLLEERKQTVLDNYVDTKEVERKYRQIRTENHYQQLRNVNKQMNIPDSRPSLPKLPPINEKGAKGVSMQLIAQRKSMKDLYHKENNLSQRNLFETVAQTITINGKIFYLQVIL